MTGPIPVLAFRPGGSEASPLPRLGSAYRMRTEKSLQGALQTVMSDHPSVIIVDGRDDAAYAARFIKSLRALELPFDLRFVMLAEHCDSVTLAHGLRAGADAMLCPPFKSGELNQAVDRLARRPPTPIPC